MSRVSDPGRRADAVRNRQLALEAATDLLGEPGMTLTVEAIAKRAGLGAGTVVRAFGSKETLLDAAVSGLLRPVVDRAQHLLATEQPERALRTFLAELMTFQADHHAISDQLNGLDLPVTTALRADLARAVERMLAKARRDGTVRTDIRPAVLTTLIAETAFGMARAGASQQHIDAYLTVLMDGLRPRPRGPERGGLA
jgi:AcrR family transcriptional regulator